MLQNNPDESKMMMMMMMMVILNKIIANYLRRLRRDGVMTWSRPVVSCSNVCCSTNWRPAKSIIAGLTTESALRITRMQSLYTRVLPEAVECCRAAIRALRHAATPTIWVRVTSEGKSANKAA
jgi:hypothetical protein